MLNIQSYGGAGDGVTDNVTPLMLAFAALGATGGQIYFPAGKYKFSSNVALTFPTGQFSVSIVGDGSDATILTWPSAHGGLTFNYQTIASSFHIRDLSLTTGTTDGGNALTLNLPLSVAGPAITASSDIVRVTFRGDDAYAGVDYWTTGLNIANVSNINVDSCAFFGAASPAGQGIYIVGLPSSSTYAVVLNVAKSDFNWLNTGLLYGSYVQGITVDQGNFTGNISGIKSAVGETGVLAQLGVSNSQFGIFQAGNGIVTGTMVVVTQITNSLFIVTASGANAVFLESCGHFTITGNCVTSSINSGTNGIVIGATQAKGIITGNDVFGFTSGIYLQAASHNVAVVSNTLSNNIYAISNQGSGNTISPNY